MTILCLMASFANATDVPINFYTPETTITQMASTGIDLLGSCPLCSPPNTIKLARAFTLNAATKISRIAFYVYSPGCNVVSGNCPTGPVTLTLETDDVNGSNHFPSGTLANANGTTSFTPTSSTWNRENSFNLTPFTLNAGTYWGVLSVSQQEANTFWRFESADLRPANPYQALHSGTSWALAASGPTFRLYGDDASQPDPKPIKFYSGITGSCGPAGYTDDANTVLLFNAEVQPFVDSSHQGHILSAIGPTPAVGTSVSNGCYSFYSTSYVPYTADSDDFTFGTGDFTAEACIKPVGNLAVAGGNIFSKADTIAPSGWGFGYFNPNPSTGRLGFGYKVNSVAVTEKYALTSPFVIGNWYHLEVDRHLNTLYFFVNGNSIGTADISAYPNMRDSDGNLEIGAWGGGGQYVDEARITKGVARHTENFTSHCGDYGWSDKPINFYSLTR